MTCKFSNIPVRYILKYPTICTLDVLSWLDSDETLQQEQICCSPSCIIRPITLVCLVTGDADFHNLVKQSPIWSFYKKDQFHNFLSCALFYNQKGSVNSIFQTPCQWLLVRFGQCKSFIRNWRGERNQNMSPIFLCYRHVSSKSYISSLIPASEGKHLLCPESWIPLKLLLLIGVPHYY